MERFLEVNEVAFAYGNEYIFMQMTFALEKGDFLVVLGPNGSGKTTLLRLLAGLSAAASGQILLQGEPIAVWQGRGEIGFVPQHYNKNATAFPATVTEIVRMGLLRRAGAKAAQEEVVRDALKRVGMEAFAQRRIGELSGGQQQRVLVAQAIVKHPLVLLLDEPTSGIDYLAGAELMAMLRQLNKELGTTIIMVSHDVERAVSYGNKVACMNRGLCYFGDESGFRERHGSGIHFSYAEKV